MWPVKTEMAKISNIHFAANLWNNRSENEIFLYYINRISKIWKRIEWMDSGAQSEQNEMCMKYFGI